MADFQIRDARPDEHAAIGALTRAAYGEYATIMTPPAWEGLRQAVETGLATQDAGERIVAVQDGRLVGSVLLYPPTANAYAVAGVTGGLPELRLLAVDPAARGLGVGLALVRECLRRTAAAGYPALGLHTSESMRAARHMYEQLGFVRVPATDFQVEGSELIMGFRRDIQPEDFEPAYR
jgi:predicted N-acetyltransferase YhbS